MLILFIACMCVCVCILPPVVCGRAHVLFMLFVFVCLRRVVLTHIVLCCSSSCVPCVASFSRLYISVFSSVFFIHCSN